MNKCNVIAALIGYAAIVTYSYYQESCKHADTLSQLKKLEWKCELSDAREKLNEAQISDMEWQLSSARTYEDGFRDAMTYSDSQAFIDGYHRAIGQNSEEISRLNALLDNKVKNASASQIAEQAQP